MANAGSKSDRRHSRKVEPRLDVMTRRNLHAGQSPTVGARGVVIRPKLAASPRSGKARTVPGRRFGLTKWCRRQRCGITLSPV